MIFCPQQWISGYPCQGREIPRCYGTWSDLLGNGIQYGDPTTTVPNRHNIASTPCTRKIVSEAFPGTLRDALTKLERANQSISLIFPHDHSECFREDHRRISFVQYGQAVAPSAAGAPPTKSYKIRLEIERIESAVFLVCEMFPGL